MRVVFFLLVLANLLVFAWWQGYFGAPDDGHEPQRLTQQLHPEKLRILADVPAAGKDSRACRSIDGLKPADAETLKAAVVAGGGEARISPIAEPTSYLVLLGGLADQAAADKKAAELNRLGFEGQKLVAVGDGRYEFILGSFPTDAAAGEFLRDVSKRGIKAARVEARELPPQKVQVELRAAASALPQLLKFVAAGATVAECAP